MKKAHHSAMHSALTNISSQMGALRAALDASPPDDEAGEGGSDDGQAMANKETQQQQRVGAGGIPTAKMPGVKKNTIIAALKARKKKGK